MSGFDPRVNSEVREVRRLEVINGALGRRRWSAEAKARIVAESLAPGGGDLGGGAAARSAAAAAVRLAAPGPAGAPRAAGRGAGVRAGGPDRQRGAARCELGPARRDHRGCATLAGLPRRSRTAEAIRYALKLWSGLCLFLDDGRIEIDSNTVERAIRPIALNRKNALFAGSDQGGVHWGVIASLIETCKLNAVDPQANLAEVLSRRVNRHPASQIHQLMPWAYANQVA